MSLRLLITNEFIGLSLHAAAEQPFSSKQPLISAWLNVAVWGFLFDYFVAFLFYLYSFAFSFLVFRFSSIKHNKQRNKQFLMPR